MADKFKNSYPINVTMADGEQPSARKLNAINTQAKNGLALVERALGDVWNQSGDAVYSSLPLRIPNLARSLGDQSKTTGKLLLPDMAPSETIVIRQEVAVGTTEIQLDWVPEAGTGSILEILILAQSEFDTKVANRSLINTSSKFCVEASAGRVVLGSPWPITYIEYAVTVQNLRGEEAANIIPIPSQSDWKGLKLVKRASGKFFVYLPPRRPPTQALGGKVPSASNAVIPASIPTHRYWYTEAGAWSAPSNPESDTDYGPLVTDKRYRYRLPAPLYALMTDSGSAGTELPSGSIYLWDNTENTIIEGITFRVPEQNDAYPGAPISPRPVWVLQIEGAILDSLFSGLDSGLDTDNPGDYEERFSLVTVGNSVSGSIDNLQRELIGSRPSTGLAPRVRHGDLLGNQPPAQGTRFSPLPASYTDGDDHPHLLSRLGSHVNAASQRDRFNNGLLGDLLLLSKDLSNNRQNTLGDSQAIRFNEMTNGASIEFRKNIFPTGSESITTRDGILFSNFPVSIDAGRIGFPGGGLIHSEDYGELYLYGPGNNYGELDFYVGSVGSVYDGGPITGLIDTSKSIKMHATALLNKIDFTGNSLDISATSGPNAVFIGYSNPQTHLFINNGIAYFSNTNRLKSVIDTSFNLIDVEAFGGGFTAAGVRTGTLFTTQRAIHFDSDPLAGNTLDRLPNGTYRLRSNSVLAPLEIGNLGVTGSISATGHLSVGGDAEVHLLTVDGLLPGISDRILAHSHIRPAVDNAHSLGDPSYRWRSIMASSMHLGRPGGVGTPTGGLNDSAAGTIVYTGSGSALELRHDGIGSSSSGLITFWPASSDSSRLLNYDALKVNFKGSTRWIRLFDSPSS